MASTAVYKCNNCGDSFTARIADRKRGWAKSCSKACKASRQTRKTGIGAGGAVLLPNGGTYRNGAEYDKHDVFVGVRLSQADMDFDD